MTTDFLSLPSTRKRMPSQTIALLGLFGTGNLGNDGSMEAMLTFLRERHPGSQIWCISVDPEFIQQTYSVRTLHIGKGFTSRLARKFDKLFLRVPSGTLDMLRTLNWARKFDILLAPGTGLLDDFGTGPAGWPYTLFKWCLAAKLCRTEIWFVSIGAGPILHPVSRWLMKCAARMAHYRSYRDNLSKDFMTSIGFEAANDRVYPDIAFKLKAPEGASRVRANPDTLTIGVGVMSYHGWHGWAEGGREIYSTYLDRMSIFVLWLLDCGYHVRLLTGESSDWRAIDDLLTIINTARESPPTGRVVADRADTLHDIMTQIAETDFVVATRFHNIVCALKMGRPTISLGYAKKNDVLMAVMGLGAYCQHVERFDVDILINQFSQLVANRETCERAVRDRTREFAQLLEQQDRYLLSTITALSQSNSMAVAAPSA